ncbi:hypothetical protein ScPMuIL_003659 [Solemya velum]
MSLLIFACLIGVASAGCCIPKQWEGVEGMLMGTVHWIKPRLTRGMLKVHWDATNQKLATNSSYDMDGKRFSLTTLEDYSQGMQYIVMDDKCKKLKLNRTFPEGCIPDSAKELGTYHLGAGSNTLDATSYYMKRGELETMISVTKEGCIPLGEDTFGRFKRRSVLQTVSFANISPGIQDPSVFDVPAACQQDVSEDLESERVPSVFGF